MPAYCWKTSTKVKLNSSSNSNALARAIISDELITDASITYGVYDATSMHFGKTVTRDDEDLIAFIQGIDLVELFLSMPWMNASRSLLSHVTVLPKWILANLKGPLGYHASMVDWKRVGKIELCTCRITDYQMAVSHLLVSDATWYSNGHFRYSSRRSMVGMTAV